MKLVIVPAAVAELRDAAAFYSAQGGVSLANQFVDDFERVVNLIVASPHLGAPFRGNWRRYFLRKFPYSVIYQITPAEVRVLALAHHRRRPDYWRKRK